MAGPWRSQFLSSRCATKPERESSGAFTSPETLIEAIRMVAAGGTYLYAPPVSATARNSVKGSWQHTAFDAPESLTEREQEVLRLMASGINNREIADALLLSEGTVKNHISSIFSKLGVADRTKAVLHAIVKGLV